MEWAGTGVFSAGGRQFAFTVPWEGATIDSRGHRLTAGLLSVLYIYREREMMVSSNSKSSNSNSNSNTFFFILVVVWKIVVCLMLLGFARKCLIVMAQQLMQHA